MPVVGKADGLRHLGVAQFGVEDELAARHGVEIGVLGHDAHIAAAAEPLDEGGIDVGVLFHLKRRGDAAFQEFAIGQRADRQALVTAQNRDHRHVHAGDAGEPGILRATAKHRVADVIVGRDEARRDHLAAPVDDPGRAGMRVRDLIARPHGDDAVAFDVDRTRIENTEIIVDGQDGGVFDENAHRGCSPQ